MKKIYHATGPGRGYTLRVRRHHFRLIYRGALPRTKYRRALSGYRSFPE